MQFTAQLTIIATMAAMVQLSAAAPIAIPNNAEARGLGSLALGVVAPELVIPYKAAKVAGHAAHGLYEAHEAHKHPRSAIPKNNAEARGLGSLALGVVAPELVVPYKVAKVAGHVAHGLYEAHEAHKHPGSA
jgi:hypothetical protein